MQLLKEISAEGFSKEIIEASMNTIEFSLRENNTGRFPRGLSLMMRSLSSWNYDQDPIKPLYFEERLGKLKERVSSGLKMQKNVINQFLSICQKG